MHLMTSNISAKVKMKIMIQLLPTYSPLWRGIFSDLNFLYAHFPTEGATAEQLFPVVQDAVRNLEESGFKVMV